MDVPPSPIQVAPTTPSSRPRKRRATSAPGHHGNHRAQVADHRKEPLARTAAMDVAVAGAHGSERRAEVGPQRVDHRFAERQPAGHVADQRTEKIALAQRDPERCAEGLLAGAEEHAAVDFARAVEAGDFLLQRTGQEHPAKGFQVERAARTRGRRHLGGGGVRGNGRDHRRQSRQRQRTGQVERMKMHDEG